MTEGGLLYVALATGIVVIALQALVLLRAGLARECLTRAGATFRAVDRFERELRQELALGRQEAANAARGDREEQSLSLSRLAQTLAAQLAQLGKLQAQQLESFAQHCRA
jgi:DNA recombination protein RmuC